MAKWKKVIVSGSDAELHSITGSGGIKFTNLPSSSNVTPLVIDSSGIVSTGSKYALASGGNTVGGSDLLANYAIIGNGGSLIRTASSDDDNHVNFNSAYIKGVSNITASGAISGSVIKGQTFEIGPDLHNFAKYTSASISLGHSGSKTIITGSSIILRSETGGITASVVPETQKPPFYLGIKADGELIKIDERNVQGGGGSSGVAGLSSTDNNIYLNSDAVSSTTSQDLGASVLVNHNGTQIFLAKDSSFLNGIVTPSVGDTIIIKTTPSNASGTDEFTTTIIGIDEDGGTLPVNGIPAGEDGNDDVLPLNMSLYPAGTLGTTAYAGYVSMSIEHAWSGSNGDNVYDSLGSLIFLQTAGTEEGVVNIQLNTQSLSVGHITQSGNLLFSGSDENHTTHTISYHQPDSGPHDILNISASNIAISGAAFISGNLDIAGTLGFDGFFFSEGDVTKLSGSNVFGSSSENTQRFTGSVFITGSGLTLNLLVVMVVD